ncbi:hypothetical protein SKAU_G00419550 [Synaphobranchus kaupii]|uniref:ornithine decarboxylase n=1 Tax=Synaphobranchus kaupii TaxID=118154 RepID=A0A9Q1IB16_SYNKA|nr:hypothetical protein SKAU_G00419550 [Synaphobranchus kaupii]
MSEIQLVQSLGVDPSRIIYANPCKQISHLKYASAHRVQMMTFDNVEELVKVARCHENGKLVLRIATDDSKAACPLSMKFGAMLKSCRFHVGSGCTDPETYTQAISDARCVFDMGAELGYNMTLLDIGGGFPGSDDSKLKFEEFTAVINPALDKYFPAHSGVQVIAEPGRYYPTSAYTLAVNIIGKRVVMKEQSACDGATAKLITITWHGALLVLATPLWYQKPKLDERTYPCSIWGQTCDGLDRIVERCILSDLQLGERLLFNNMGAYSVTFSTTFYGFNIHYVMSRSAWQRIQQSSPQGLLVPAELARPGNVPSCWESSLENVSPSPRAGTTPVMRKKQHATCWGAVTCLERLRVRHGGSDSELKTCPVRHGVSDS